jgi:hypothetical protein
MQTEVYKRTADATDVTNGYFGLNITPWGVYSNRVDVGTKPENKQHIVRVTAKIATSAGAAISWADILIGIRNPDSQSDKVMIPVKGIGNPEYAITNLYGFVCNYGFDVIGPCYTSGDVLTVMVMREAVK